MENVDQVPIASEYWCREDSDAGSWVRCGGEKAKMADLCKKRLRPWSEMKWSDFNAKDGNALPRPANLVEIGEWSDSPILPVCAKIEEWCSLTELKDSDWARKILVCKSQDKENIWQNINRLFAPIFASSRPSLLSSFTWRFQKQKNRIASLGEICSKFSRKLVMTDKIVQSNF